MAIHVGSDDEYTNLLQGAGERLVVVDFFATWCGPCHRIAPFYESLAASHPEALFLKVDVDRLKRTAQAARVSAMVRSVECGSLQPTFHFYLGGSLVSEFKGADERQLENTLRALLPPPAPRAAAPSGSVPVAVPVRFEGSSDALARAVARVGALPGLDTLQALLADTRYYHATRAPPGTAALLAALVARDDASLFAALDVVRMAVLHDDVAAVLAASPEAGAVAERVVALVEGLAARPYAAALMTLRLLANMLAAAPLRALLAAHWDRVLAAVEGLTHPFAQPAARVALATALLNGPSVERVQLVPPVLLAAAGEDDADALARHLAALGTLAADCEEVAELVREGVLMLCARAAALPEPLPRLAADVRKVVDAFPPLPW